VHPASAPQGEGVRRQGLLLSTLSIWSDERGVAASSSGSWRPWSSRSSASGSTLSAGIARIAPRGKGRGSPIGLCRWQQWRHCHCIKQPDLPGRADRLRQSHRRWPRRRSFSRRSSASAPPLSSAARAGGIQLHQYCLLALASDGKRPTILSHGSNSANLTGCSIMSNTGSTCTGHSLQATYGDAHGTNNGCGITEHSNVPAVSDPYSVSPPGPHRTASRPTPVPLTILSRRRKTGRTWAATRHPPSRPSCTRLV
jgi:hypothetical protein